jgi:hypothetical protein
VSGSGPVAVPIGLPERGSTRRTSRLARTDYATAAWLCVVPAALATVAAIVLLGPSLGELISRSHSGFTPLPERIIGFHPEPAEQAGYLLALSGPVLYATLLALAPRWLPRLPGALATAWARATPVLLAAFLVVCMVMQYDAVYDPIYSNEEPQVPRVVQYFTPATLVVAALLAAALAALAATRPRVVAGALLRESRAKHAAGLAAAALATVVWLLPAINSDSSIGMTPGDLQYHLEFTLDEAFAVLNGLTPLVDFSPQYGSLVPYLAALPMVAFGKTLLTYTIAMAALTGLGMLAVYGVLRRVARSTLAALLLYLPFLATSFFLLDGTLANRSSVGTYFSTFPTRYAGPFMLAWLVARQLGARELAFIRLWPLFTAAGLVAVNNTDFGVAALGACLVAIVWGSADRLGDEWRRIAAALLAGLASALVLVSALTLLRAGSLPQFGRSVEFTNLFAVSGFGMLPIGPRVGLHLILYVTYVAAIGLATVRALQGSGDRALTGMLAWAGIFGLGSAAYFIGRSSPDTLKYVFSPWALTLALLTVAVVRASADSPSRRPTIAALAVLVGLGLTICSLAQTPLPWTQLERVQAPFRPWRLRPKANPLQPPADAQTRQFVAGVADGRTRIVIRRGAPVAIMTTLGHRVADAYGVVNVSPFTGLLSTPTKEQVNMVVDALRAAGGNTILLPHPDLEGAFDVLAERGFMPLTANGLEPYVAGQTDPAGVPWPDGSVLVKWVDVRHLHPRALD